MYKKIIFITVIFISIWLIAIIEKVPIYQVCKNLFIYKSVFAWFFWGFVFSLPLIYEKTIEYKRKYVIDDFQVQAVELFAFSKKEPVYEKDAQNSIELVPTDQGQKKFRQNRMSHNYEN